MINNEDFEIERGKRLDLLKPNKPLTIRQKQVAKLISLGKSNKEIAATLGYSETWISQLRNSKKINIEIHKLVLSKESSIRNQIDYMLNEAFENIEYLLRSPYANPTLKYKMAKWIAEVLDGKPATSSFTQNANLLIFFDLIKNL